MTNSVINLEKEPLASFADWEDGYALRPWANVSLHLYWTMVSVGVVYGLFVSCHFASREKQRKISTFMAVVVQVVTAGLFVFNAYLSVRTLMMIRVNFQLFQRYRETVFIFDSDEDVSIQKIITRSLWSKVLIVFQCCGFASYTDWAKIEQNFVPDNCCRLPKPGYGKNFFLENIYQRGCEEKLTIHIKHQYIIQTHDDQIVYLLVSVVFGVTAILITFFFVKAWWYNCGNNHNRENGYMLVNDEERQDPLNEAENPEDQLAYIFNRVFHDKNTQRLFEEVLGPWRDSEDAVFWNIYGEKHFSGNTF